MPLPKRRLVPALAFLVAVPVLLQAAAPPAAEEKLPGFRTVEDAIPFVRGKAAAGTTPQTPYLGVHLGAGAAVESLDPDSPAAAAGVRAGDVLTQAGGRPVRAADDLRRALAGKTPGDAVELILTRAGKALAVKAKLTAASSPLASDAAPVKGKGWDKRGGGGKWAKGAYRLAVVLIKYPDAKPNKAITPQHWEDSLFSKGTYTQTNATGQRVYGSMNDHYLEQSYGKLRIEGKAFPYVKVSKNRADYGKQGASRQALLTEALDLVIKRDGKDALQGFDGVFFMYAGGRMQVARGSLYWPHRSSVRHNGVSWPYFICPEGGERMYDISVLSHEFGHMLGLPDLYARPENPGSEGLGNWCLMSNQTGRGRPQHMSAWCKERLGWLTPTAIDPAVPQDLVLSPIYKSPRECFKVPVRPDGSEYFLLENRAAHGFDAALPAHGLLVWRVVRGRPILEESHGVAGPSGPRVYANMVPFPSKSNDSFTPFTVPSSRAQLGGGTPVHITNIRKLPDGRITFSIGREFY